MKIAGKIHVLGDDINTDYIISSKYKSTILDLDELAQHVLEDYDPDFAGRLNPGDIVAAGNNFGCGSARETAPLVLKQAGVAAVIARSFARIFFRNAHNVGLPIIEFDTRALENGDQLELDLVAGCLVNHTQGKEATFSAPPAEMLAILKAGGLLEYYRHYHHFPWT